MVIKFWIIFITGFFKNLTKWNDIAFRKFWFNRRRFASFSEKSAFWVILPFSNKFQIRKMKTDFHTGCSNWNSGKVKGCSSELVFIWPHVSKTKVRLRGRRFIQFSKNVFTLFSCLFTITVKSLSRAALLFHFTKFWTPILLKKNTQTSWVLQRS